MPLQVSFRVEPARPPLHSAQPRISLPLVRLSTLAPKLFGAKHPVTSKTAVEISISDVRTDFCRHEADDALFNHRPVYSCIGPRQGRMDNKNPTVVSLRTRPGLCRGWFRTRKHDAPAPGWSRHMLPFNQLPSTHPAAVPSKCDKEHQLPFHACP